MEACSPLAQLLHALNQPLTGLQCSMEVALANPRTSEQYVHGLREGLELTERMRALVEAIREVTDVEEEKQVDSETTELQVLLREILEDLEPVAEVNGIRISLDCPTGSSLLVTVGRRRADTAIFRVLESVLSLAATGTALRIEMRAVSAEVSIRIRWHAGRPQSVFSRPELGLLVARARLEQAGGAWDRERAEKLETVTVHLPKVSSESRNS
jgi:signal transduction histidine kinase